MKSARTTALSRNKTNPSFPRGLHLFYFIFFSLLLLCTHRKIFLPSLYIYIYSLPFSLFIFPLTVFICVHVKYIETFFSIVWVHIHVYMLCLFLHVYTLAHMYSSLFYVCIIIPLMFLLPLWSSSSHMRASFYVPRLFFLRIYIIYVCIYIYIFVLDCLVIVFVGEEREKKIQAHQENGELYFLYLCPSEMLDMYSLFFFVYFACFFFLFFDLFTCRIMNTMTSSRNVNNCRNIHTSEKLLLCVN